MATTLTNLALIDQINDAFFPPEVQSRFTGQSNANDTVAMFGAKAIMSLEDTGNYFGNASHVTTAADIWYRPKSSNKWSKAATLADLPTDQNTIAEYSIYNLFTPSTTATTTTTATENKLLTLYTALDNIIQYDFRYFKTQYIKDLSFKDITSTSNVQPPLKSFNIVTDLNTTEIYLNSLEQLARPDVYDIKSRTNFFVLKRLCILYKLKIQYYILSQYGTEHAGRILNIIQRINSSFINKNIDNYNLAKFSDDTMEKTMYYQANINNVKTLSKNFETLKGQVDAAQKIKDAKQGLIKKSAAMKYTMLSVCFALAGALIYAVASPSDKSTIISIIVLCIAVITALVFFFVSRQLGLEEFTLEGFLIPPSNPSSASQVNSGFGIYQNMALAAAQQDRIEDAMNIYLNHTLVAGNTVQTNDIYTTMGRIQTDEINNLQDYLLNLDMKYGEVEQSAKMIDSRALNNITFSWLLIGLVVIASATLSLQSILSKIVLATPIIFVTGGVTATFFALAMLIKMYSRTRRDPRKFYFKKPNFDQYKAE